MLDVLGRINRDHGTAIMLISHNLAVVSSLCQRVLVMYAGRIVEDVDAATLESGAAHPYTKALMAIVPDLKTDRTTPLVSIPGRPPRLAELKTGCPFAPRCPAVTEQCRSETPELVELSRGHRVACFVATERTPEVSVRG